MPTDAPLRRAGPVVAQACAQPNVLSGSTDRFCHDYPCHSPSENRWSSARATPAVINDGRGAVITHLDITGIRTIEQSMAHQSVHDPLTDLPKLDGTITQLVLHYKPVVDLTSGKVVAVESLARWQHPVRGLLGPDRFIPLAESTGLVHTLGDWVLDQAIRDAASLTHQGRELDIAVNLSVQQLDDRAVEKVRRAIETSGLRPSRLILELTESAFVEDEATTAATLAALSELGVTIAIDDFGTGYSSLLYVRRYPVDVLTIDREFVAGIGQSADDEAICSSITSLATAVGASTVAEGVETMDQYAVLRSLGCHQGQGFLWSPAVPISGVGAALASCDKVPVPARRSRTSPDA